MPAERRQPAPQSESGTVRNVAILGSTGSIGASTLEVIASVPGLGVRVFGLACGNNVDVLAGQVERFSPERVVISNEASANAFRSKAPGDICVDSGAGALEALASHPSVDVVVMAIVGAAALPPTLAALRAGKTVALANKECLVMAGDIVMETARKAGARIIPVDSEHSAAFQLMTMGRASEIKRLVITGSGGALRDVPCDELSTVTPERALAHPNWDMGPKVTIDSATSMNKALELIEAHHLFGLPAEALGVWVHPQSLVHAVVEYLDGTTVMHASRPDMRLPIQYALSLGRSGRLPGPVPQAPVDTLSGILFSEPDPVRLPAIELGLRVCRAGGTLGAVLNAANEVAVDAFLKRRIPFTKIVGLVREVLDEHANAPSPSLERILDADAEARKQAAAKL